MLLRQKIHLGMMVGLVLLLVGNLSRAQVAPTSEGSSASPFFIRSWEVGQGLPSSTVTAITQTRDGYLWLGTEAGLARFDGVQYRVFGLRDGLKNLQISALLEDHAGTLWIGTAGGGLGKMTAGKIEMFTLKDGLAGDSISSLLEATNGDIWIGTHTGLSRWHAGKFAAPGKVIKPPFVFDLAKDHHGNIWVATLHTGLLRFHDGQFSVADGESGLSTITNNPRCLLVDNQDRVWAGMREKNLLCWDNGKITFYGTNEGFPAVILNRLAQTADGTIWAGSLDEGLFYFQNGRFNVLRKKDGLPDDAVLSLFAGQEQLLWIGTRSGGLSRLNSRKLSVYHAMAGDSTRLVRSLAQTTNGDLWVGTFGQGVFRWQGAQFDQAKIEHAPIRLDNLTELMVEALFGASDGSLWWGAGPHLYQTKNGNALYYYDNGWLSGDRVWSLCEALGGGIWVGTFNGQLRLVSGTNITTIKGLSGKPITSLVEQPDGTLWIGSLGDGLLQWKNGKLTTFTTANGLGSDLIRTLSLDADGTVWIGTDGGGLTRFADGKFTAFTTEQGLINDTVLQILSDDDNGLWLGFNQGICRVSKRVIGDVAEGRGHTLHPLIFGTTDGMPTEECVGNFGAALKTADGLLRFATTKGIVVIDPHKQLTHISVPAVIVEQVLVDGQPLAASEKTDASEPPIFQTTPGRHNFEIRYTGLSFNAPERVRFKYRLDGWDSDWVDVGDERIARYNVPPGTYHFHVIACNSNGQWNEVGATLTLEVPPHFWQSNWFGVPCSLLLIAAVAVLVRWLERSRYRAQLKRLKQEEATNKERSRIARDLHDELGSSLTSIAMLSDLGQFNPSREERLTKLEKRVQKISASALYTVRSLDEIVWAINPRNDSLESLLSYLTQCTREHFENQELSCRFRIPHNVPELRLLPELRHNVFLIVKGALDNTQKYAQASEVCLGAKVSGSRVEISVQDNGIGFDQAAVASTQRTGLDHMRRRAGNLGGQLIVETQPGQGTTVKLILNVALNHTGRENK